MCCTARRWYKPSGPIAAADLGRRVRVLWQGAEYRGRGRETIWQGKLTLTGNRIARFAAVNFLNPERQVARLRAASRWPGPRSRPVTWRASISGSTMRRSGTMEIETNVVSGEVDLATLADTPLTFDGGGLGRKLSVYRLPEADWSRRVVA